MGLRGEVRDRKINIGVILIQLVKPSDWMRSTKETMWMEKKRGQRSEPWTCQHLEIRPRGGRSKRVGRSR